MPKGLKSYFPPGDGIVFSTGDAHSGKDQSNGRLGPSHFAHRVAAGAKKTANDLPDRIRRTIGTHLKPEGWAQRDDQERPSMRPSTGNHLGLTTCIPCFQRTGKSKKHNPETKYADAGKHRLKIL